MRLIRFQSQNAVPVGRLVVPDIVIPVRWVGKFVILLMKKILNGLWNANSGILKGSPESGPPLERQKFDENISGRGYILSRENRPLSIDYTVPGQLGVEVIPQRTLLKELHKEMLEQRQAVDVTNNTMIGLAAEAVGKEDNYARDSGYIYQYGRSSGGGL